MQTYSTEFSSGLFEFDSNWQRIFVTALTFRLDQAILVAKKFGVFILFSSGIMLCCCFMSMVMSGRLS